MASFENHITQARHNLAFLELSNQNANAYWDWQVTVAFYVGVHLINAHIAQKSNHSYRSHEQVDQALNPYNPVSLTKLDEPNYLAYSKLQGLARRARYLCHEDHKNRTPDAQFTYDKHFARSVRNLDLLLEFVSKEYGVTFPAIKIGCLELKKTSLKYFVLEK